MVEKNDWSIVIEGYGPSHNGQESDANAQMLVLLKALEANKCHQLRQARFTSARGEENWQDPITRDLHEQLAVKHSELVQQGLDAKVEPKGRLAVKQEEPSSADRIESTAAMGLRKQGQVDERRSSGGRLRSGDSEGSVQKPPGTKEQRS